MTKPALLGHLANPDALTITPDRDDVAEAFAPPIVDPCAACGHGKAGPDGHCPADGCLVGAGTRDECNCARYMAAIPRCPHCGSMFREKWLLQNHLMPTPTCQFAARAAAGRFADRPKSGPPLANGRR